MNSRKKIIIMTISLISIIPLHSFAQIALEPYTYSENFESGEPAGRASYPLRQDTACDDNFRDDTMVQGESNISIEQIMNKLSGWHYTQPIVRSTILIDHNSQSQRTGDPCSFIDRFDDHAFVYHFLDGEQAAFSSGDIGKLYHGKVKDLKRNVLYIKPRTILMLDTVVPGVSDADVTLLFQADCLKDINASNDLSTISKDNATLFIKHISPKKAVVEAKEMPHLLREYDRKTPTRNGYLTVTARTDSVPLVIGNLLTTDSGVNIKIASNAGQDFVTGEVNDIPFAFTTSPGTVYDAGTFSTDALALTWADNGVFAALCTSLTRDNALLIESSAPITCEIEDDRMRYCLAEESWVALGINRRPNTLYVNGKSRTFMYEPEKKAAVFTLNAGEGTARFE